MAGRRSFAYRSRRVAGAISRDEAASSTPSILIDFSIIDPGGSRTHAAGFLSALARRADASMRWTVMLPRDPAVLRDEASSLVAAGIGVKRVGSARRAGSWSSRIAGQIAVPLAAAKLRPDVTFVSREVGPVLLPGRRVHLAANVLRWRPTPSPPGGQGRRSALVRWRIALKDRLARRAVARADEMITASEVIGGMLPSGTSYQVIPFGVDLAEHHPSGQELTDRVPLRVMVLAALTVHKRLDVVIRAVSILRAEGVDVVLEVWGHEPQPEEARRLRSLGARLLGPRCRFHGAARPEDRWELLRDAHILALGSGTESFGFPMIEAMRTSTAVLAPDAPIAREICGDVGFYYREGDPASAASVAWSIATASIADLEEHLHAGVERSLEFTWDRCVDQTLAVLEAVARRGAPSSRVGIRP